MRESSKVIGSEHVQDRLRSIGGAVTVHRVNSLGTTR
jgi:hypothetical protein